MDLSIFGGRACGALLLSIQKALKKLRAYKGTDQSPRSGSPVGSELPLINFKEVIAWL
jgi:hypothetical protein